MRALARPFEFARGHYDVIIIGSGYGGGVSASRLSRAGKKVAVLERGREVLTGQFPNRFSDLKNEFRVTGKRVRTGSATGLYDIRLGDDMHVLVGCGLGGGSLVNAGVTLRPDTRVFSDSVWPGQIAQDGHLDEGYRRAEFWLRPQSDPNAFSRTKVKALAKSGAAIGCSPVAPRVAVSFAANTNPAGIEQAACTGCGDCCGGCNVGAKNTVAMTYLPDAVRHGAELFTHATVRDVTRGRDGLWHVRVHPSEAKDGEGEREMTANAVILAAGTLGSTEILLRSRERGLALSDRLGHRFSANGDIIAFGYGAKIPVDAIGVGYPSKLEGVETGASVSGQLEVKDADNLAMELCVQEGVLPSAMAPVLPVLFVPNGRILGALQSLINGVYKGPLANLQTFFAVSHDSSAGQFRLDEDRLSLSWPNAKDEPVYARLDQILTKIVKEAGGDYVKNPLAGTVMGHQPATAHPLGGACMGHDASTGVVNHKGQVFDTSTPGSTSVHDGLYVIDGAVIPRSLGVNPLFTITALAERAMIHFAADYGLQFDVKAVAPRAAVSEPAVA